MKNKYGLKKPVPNRTMQDEQNRLHLNCTYHNKCFDRECLEIKTCMYRINAIEHMIELEKRVVDGE